MPDRVVRDELLQSERWLDLPSDTHRLIYENLILIADDYGNLKGGPRRMYRWMHSFTQIKSEPDAIKLMSDLQDGDLVGRYEIDGIEYWHLHRFKNSRKYWSRKWPTSPYPESNKLPTKQEETEKPNPTLTPIEPRTPGGVGVGVGDLPLSKAPKKQKRETSDSEKQKRELTWHAYSDAYFERWHVHPKQTYKANIHIAQFCNELSVDEAPHIAAFYVRHDKQQYVSASHDLKLMVRDVSGLRTQWATNKPITESQARQIDKTAGRGNVFREIEEDIRAKPKP